MKKIERIELNNVLIAGGGSCGCSKANTIPDGSNVTATATASGPGVASAVITVNGKVVTSQTTAGTSN